MHFTKVLHTTNIKIIKKALIQTDKILISKMSYHLLQKQAWVKNNYQD